MSDSFDTLYPLVCLYLRVFVSLIKVQLVCTPFWPTPSVVCGFVMLRFHDNREAVTGTLAAFSVALSHFQLLRDLSMTGQYGTIVRNIMSYEIPK